jgi:hypothetical protein
MTSGVGETNQVSQARESRANRWIERAGVRVLNVETVLLPNVEETDQGAAFTQGGTDRWRQFIRVWYVESE